MAVVKITTLSHVNARRGPGIEYDVKNKVSSNETLDSKENKTDARGIVWYNTNKGWICGKYVSLAKDLQAQDLAKTRKVADTTVSGKVVQVDNKRNTGTSIAERVTGGSGAVNTGITQVEGLLGGLSGAGLNFLNQGGVTPEDVFLSRRMFGVPYQWLESTDWRSGSPVDQELGHFYFDMLKEAPRLCVLPGKPMFLADMDAEAKKSYVEAMVDALDGISDRLADGLGKKLTGQEWFDQQEDNYDMKFFSFQQDWTDFRMYFNTMVQQTAIFMGIGNEVVPGADIASPDKATFGRFDWSDYTLSMYMAGRGSIGATSMFGAGGGAEGVTGAVSDLGKKIYEGWNAVYGAATNTASQDEIDAYSKLTNEEKYYTEFYINPNISYSESFSNVTSPSIFAQLFETASETAKEFGFFMDNVRFDSEGRAGATNEQAANAIRGAADAVGLGGTGIGGVLNRFIHGATTVLSGANLVFPDIWKNANFGKSYNIEIELKTAYGNRKNIFMDLFVPAWFWICLTAPRQMSVNSFRSPFLLRCHVPGIFSSDMAIVESLNIMKGGDGTAWSAEGFPLEMRLSIQIRELYSALFTSAVHSASMTDAYNYLWNTSLHDYIGAMSGLDMRESDIFRKLQVAKTLAQNSIENTFSHPFDYFAEKAAEKARNILRR